MGIQTNFGVGNIKSAPGIIADITANKPGATVVADGTIFIDQTLLQIEQSISGVWQVISGGGPPGTPGIDDVLSVGQLLTANRQIDLNGNNFGIYNLDGLNPFNPVMSFSLTPFGPSFTFGDFPTGGITFFNNSSNPYFYTSCGNLQFGITGRNDAIERSVKIGEYQSLVNGTFLRIDDTKESISTNFNGAENWFIADKQNQIVKFGDFAGTVNQVYFDCNGSELRAIEGTVINGFHLDFPDDVYRFGQIANGNFFEQVDVLGANDWNLYNVGTPNGLKMPFSTGVFYFGDFAGQFGPATFYEANASASEAIIHCEKFSLRDSGTGNLLAATAGGSSGQHLILNIDGTNYKIALLNP